MASTGESLAAFLAGKTPKIIPIKTQTTKAIIIASTVIVAGKNG